LFDANNFSAPIVYNTGDAMSECWPCGQKEGKMICAGGSHIDAAATFCSRRIPPLKIRTTVPKGTPQDAKLAIKIVEFTIDSYKSSGDVGGKIDVVELDKGGGVHWLARKDNCPENED
jgi:hypothetical protein